MSSKVFGIAGVDEAGRGPMIGPLVVCGVLVNPSDLRNLEALGLKDSKTLSSSRREQLELRIRDLASKIVLQTIAASEIDARRRRGTTLNEIEVDAFAAVIQSLRPLEVFVDAADVNADRFGAAIAIRSGLAAEKTRFISEHKADAKYPIVSAASIVAKVERDRRIRELHGEYGDFGSGYPNDPKSIDFVRGLMLEGQEMPDIVRRSWESVKRIRSELGQTDLSRY
ncbi:MAG: ribonuclease HII [Candidatus Thorarchaeota archaeon]|nr:MAG: ribonuclease HII [Candidatus Thorarchaeota archaeon]